MVRLTGRILPHLVLTSFGVRLGGVGLIRLDVPFPFPVFPPWTLRCVVFFVQPGCLVGTCCGDARGRLQFGGAWGGFLGILYQRRRPCGGAFSPSPVGIDGLLCFASTLLRVFYGGHFLGLLLGSIISRLSAFGIVFWIGSGLAFFSLGSIRAGHGSVGFVMGPLVVLFLLLASSLFRLDPSLPFSVLRLPWGFAIVALLSHAVFILNDFANRFATCFVFEVLLFLLLVMLLPCLVSLSS
jgi:hypothetical protein